MSVQNIYLVMYTSVYFQSCRYIAFPRMILGDRKREPGAHINIKSGSLKTRAHRLSIVDKSNVKMVRKNDRIIFSTSSRYLHTVKSRKAL
jgi:hypothetical protein